MTESAKKLWIAVDLEINDYLGDGAESYCLTDKILDEIREKYTAMNLTSRIGLKRRIGNVLKARGYTETSTSPPTWVSYPVITTTGIVGEIFNPEPPQWVRDQYLTLHQALSIIEQQYPDIMKVAVP